MVETEIVVPVLCNTLKRAFVALSFCIAPFQLSAQIDSDYASYRSGIDVIWQGTRNVDYAEEYLFYDKVIDSRKIVYVHEDTQITAAHNERNIAGVDNRDKYGPVGPEHGRIVYKIDGDRHWQPRPQDWLGFQGTITLAELDYSLFGDPTVPVVGSTGDNGVRLSLETKQTHYHRGMIGPFGDEWHILTVADDDLGLPGTGSDGEFAASDGQIVYLVVNPKTPAISWNITGTGEFYTTPAKKYFIPIIYEQTTYIDDGPNGSVSATLTDINGNEVFFRINGGSWQSNGTPSISLSSDAFADGKNTLEYYYAGNEAYIKRRIVVKNPAYPSSVEEHGDRLWGGAENWINEVAPRLDTNTEASHWYGEIKNQSFWHQRDRILAESRTGARSRAGKHAFPAALAARKEGVTAIPSGKSLSYADFAFLAMREIPTMWEPVGIELPQSNSPMPAREWHYRGYWDLDPITSALGAYDIIAGYYRRDQGYSRGLTPIQDFHIRDAFALWVHGVSLERAGYQEIGRHTPNKVEMWPAARYWAAAMAAIIMPSYSTPYYGTSGMDGSEAFYPWTPFENDIWTWKEIFISDVAGVTEFPNLNSRMLFENSTPSGSGDPLTGGHFSRSGQWFNRIGYSGSTLMGHGMILYWNLLALYAPEVDLSNSLFAMANAASGRLEGLMVSSGSDAVPALRTWAPLQNAWWPEFRDVAQPQMLALGDNDGNGTTNNFKQTMPYNVIWYNHDLARPISETKTSRPRILESNGVIWIDETEPDTTVHYTLDGSYPDPSDAQYTEPITVGDDYIVRAISLKPGKTPSSVTTLRRGNPIIISDEVSSDQYHTAIPSVSATRNSGGTYTISIESSTLTSSIYYTTNGSKPTDAALLYTQNFVLSPPFALKAIAIAPGLEDSPIRTYVISDSTSSTEKPIPPSSLLITIAK